MFNVLSFIDPSFRIHWVYVLPALLISVLFLKSFKIFTANYIFNRSMLLDIKLFSFNQILKLLVILPFEGFLVFQISKRAVIYFENFGYYKSGLTVIIAFTVLSFLIDDLFKFFQHFLMHKVPLLWEFHKVHHSAPTLNPMTLYRLHFVEIIMAFMRRVLSTSLTTFLVFTLSSELISPLSIMGIHSATFLFSLLGSNLRHSHLPISFGFLDYVFISPAQHQIHHSKNKMHHDKNFGVTLAVWDHLAGSFFKSTHNQKLNFGLSYSERNHSYKSFSSATLSPFVHTFKKNKISIPYEYIFKELPMKNYVALISTLIMLGCGSGEVGLSGSQNVSPLSFSTQKYAEDIYKAFYAHELKEVDSLLSKAAQSNSYSEQKSLVKKVILNYQQVTPFQYLGSLGELDGEIYNYEKVYSGAFSAGDCELLQLVSEVNPLEVSATLNNLEFLAFRAKQASCPDLAVENDQLVTAIQNESLRMKALISPDVTTLSSEDEAFSSNNALQDSYDIFTLFLDRDLKDKKLGGPSGQDPAKSFKGSTCTVCTEHQNSNLSYNVIVKNFETLYFIFTQEQDLNTDSRKGLYQYLVINKYSSLADKIKNLLKKGHSLASTKAGQSMFKDSESLNNPEAQQRCFDKNFEGAALCELYWIAKELSDIAKTDLRAAMALSSVVHGAGDGD